MLCGLVAAAMDVLEAAVTGDRLGRLEACAGVGDEADAGHDLLVRLHHEPVDAAAAHHARAAVAEGRDDPRRPEIGRLEDARAGPEEGPGRHHRLLLTP